MAREHGDALPDDFAARVIAHLLKSGRDDRLHLRYEAARSHFQEILDLQPGHSTALLEWGRTYGPMESPGPDQVGALERAARAAPDSLEVVAELELACRQPGREERSRELKQRVLALADRRLAANEADVEALYCKARLLRGAGEFARALPLLKSLVTLAPRDQACLYEYGLCLSRLDRHEEAAPVYESVLRGEGTTFWAFCAYRQLATHHAYRTGEMEKAMGHMEAAWRLMQSPGEAGNLIYFHSGGGRPDQGLELYEENREHLHQPRVHAAAGMGYLLACQPGEAEGAFHQALEGAPDDDFRRGDPPPPGAYRARGGSARRDGPSPAPGPLPGPGEARPVGRPAGKPLSPMVDAVARRVASGRGRGPRWCEDAAHRGKAGAGLPLRRYAVSSGSRRTSR